MSGTSLKSQYMKWLVMLLVADLAVILLFVVPGLIPANVSVEKFASWRLLTITVIPVSVLLVVNALPSTVKAMLVYWKPSGWLPGCEAFTKYGPRDRRIDMQALAKNVGALPSEPTEQNAKWYRLYKQVENEPEVLEAHRSSLMYRDMVVLSLPCIALVPTFLYVTGASPEARWLSAGLFIVQYLLTAFSGRNSGIRFVTTVLALHAVRKIPISKARQQPPTRASSA